MISTVMPSLDNSMRPLRTIWTCVMLSPPSNRTSPSAPATFSVLSAMRAISSRHGFEEEDEVEHRIISVATNSLVQMCEQPRREQAQPTVIGGGPPDGDGRIGDTRAIRVRRLYAFGSRGFANFEQRQHGPDQPTGRQAGQSLDGVRPDPWLVGLNETEQQIDVAAIAERGFHRQDSSNNPPIAVDQPVRESIAGRFTQSDARHMLQRRQIETGLSVKRSQIVVQHPLRLARSNGAQRFDRRLTTSGRSELNLCAAALTAASPFR